VNRIDVSEAQTVTAGAVLFEIVNLDTIWIRVSVYVDLLRDIQSDENAQLVSLSGDPLREPIVAKPIAAPPTADAFSSSADVYYEVDNRQIGLRPGQRIGVELPMSQPQTSRIVPAASLIYDIYGNAWVYVETGQRQYTRQRVAVQFVEADEAMLAKGPGVGTPVVVDGAAELFGTEFGAGK
ncbi:efflux RND transporter periplasmic adaptor subunit, partial [Stieleria sp.]|uniref:efflux RND transporter periplasmic adaptor subunit n=1 Tax=Stieleria sp. TaxID=2795976 RepID=UPI003567EAAF